MPTRHSALAMATRTLRVVSKVMKQKDILWQRDTMREVVERSVAGLSRESLQLLSELRGEEFADSETSRDVNELATLPIEGDDQMDWETLPDDAEGSFAHAVRDIICSRWKTRWYKDARTWRLRLERAQANWAPLISSLTDLYLSWCHLPPQPCDSPLHHDPEACSQDDEDYSFTIEVIDIYSLVTSVHVPRTRESRSQAEAIAAQGYLPTTPISPTLAILYKTLELFRRLHLRKPSFSAEAFTKVICDYYAIPYRRRYHSALSDAFDIYLSIHCVIDKRVQAELGRGTPDWRVLNACPACCYELEDEPDLKIGRMYCFDGNNSLKRLAKVGERNIGDTRCFEDSDYFLSQDFVNQFADEVKSSRSQVAQEVEPQILPRGQDEEQLDDAEGDPTDAISSDPVMRGCTQNWKSAAAEDKKKMWGIFDETGIFASACRHSFILWIVDMVRSGELAKYPLAMVAKVLQLLRPRSMGGYDIGCSFAHTIHDSSLSPEFRRLQARLCVNAFHGYTHNHACQMQNHPNVIEGMGLEDLETMERIFSKSNEVAPVTRYASRYHRRTFVDMFFGQWDADRYLSLGNFLYNNYRQALDILNNDAQVLDEAVHSLGIGDGDLDKWQKEETEYFSVLGQEPEWDVHAVAYVELLQEHYALETRHVDTTSLFLTSTPADYEFLPPPTCPSPSRIYNHELSQTRRLETQRRHIAERRQQVLRDVIAMEVHMGIVNRWQTTSTEYIETLQYVKLREYHRALDNLQRLVVQRLFELHNLNLAQTAYRVHTHMAKSLQTRCRAIRNAVNVYNALACQMDPPRPTLDWSKVTHYSFLEEFNLLRDTRNDICDKPWTRPDIRAVMKQARRVARAREEIQRLDVEVCRVHTSIYDEVQAFDITLARLKDRNDPLYGAVNDFCRRRHRVNTWILA
ncbi:hypothetical protein SCP_0803350 [Sparassis crispa]|uniref:CxC1-like cysteine cluster associated with KDZ transposases domain-containing protein n=1 Tax=Sparassis crispa TaxID=139825 RepID=A0A401GUF3_9APHY|nr:hypothetical protein SCP_0803350 [Sparassis crispa]GBE85813.1 hypothetical protein SCP_0803350 [Sparassis crispa]